MSTVIKPGPHYGCRNRKPFAQSYPAQDGWAKIWSTDVGCFVRLAVDVDVKTFGKTECQFTLTPAGQEDKHGRCQGCKWRRKANGD